MRQIIVLAALVSTLVFAGCKENHPGVDLQFSAGPAISPSAPESDQVITIAFTIVNSGPNSSGATTWKAYFADDPIAAGAVPALQKNESTTTFFQLSEVQPGDHTITVVIDPDNHVSEDTKSNNVVVIPFTVVAAPARLDLSFPAPLAVTPDPPTRSAGTVTFQISNTSAGGVTATNVHWHIFDGTTEIGSNTIPSIPANTSVNQSFNLIGTPGGTIGSHDVHVELDPNSAINETDETNNTSSTLSYTILATSSG
jgi:subtilase family serine protease